MEGAVHHGVAVDENEFFVGWVHGELGRAGSASYETNRTSVKVQVLDFVLIISYNNRITKFYGTPAGAKSNQGEKGGKAHPRTATWIFWGQATSSNGGGGGNC